MEHNLFPRVTASPHLRVEEVAPGQSGIVGRRFAHGSPEFSPSTSFDEQAHRDEVHIGHAMLVTGGYESRVREDDGQDLVSGCTGTDAQPDGQADQDIAK